MPKKRPHPHAHLLRLNQPDSLNLSEGVRGPAVSDPSLADPDLVKFDYAESVTRQEPGQSKLARLEKSISQGPLGFDEAISRHWAMEEFFWHGLPGDDWHPLEAYLNANTQRFPPAASAQLRRWKEARIGIYEVGQVSGGTVGLQEWDPLTSQLCGSPLRAIALNIGGVSSYRGQRGQLNLTYVAPWAPEANVHCAMGYGLTVKKRQAVSETALIMLGFRQPELICQPYPWKVSREAGNLALREWHLREWHGWLSERLSFPFQAFIRMPPKGEQIVDIVTGLIASDPDKARKLGIYLEVTRNEGKSVIVSGLTGIIPTDLASPNWLAIAEYHAYREQVGPPPGTLGQPSFLRIR